MPKSERDAREAYENGINRASGNPYAEAAGANSISDAARTMEQAFGKGESVDMNQMVDNWADKY